jgi:hypothetical protein
MAKDTRGALHDALAAHVQAQAEATVSGQDPAGVDRGAVEAAARAHVNASPSKDDLQTAYEAARDARYASPDDPDVLRAENDAANQLASVVQAQRVLEGRPVASHIGG